MLAEDPWLWSVNDVIDQICYTRWLFEEAGYGGLNCPPNIFEYHFRSQAVSGASLLTGIDDNVLRNEFGIHVLGHRSALIAVIQLLRSRSTRYTHQAPTAGVQALNIGQSLPDSSKENGRKEKKRTNLTTTPLLHWNDQPATPPTLGDDARASAGNEWDYLLSRYQNDDSYSLSNDSPIDGDVDDSEDEEEDEMVDEADAYAVPIEQGQASTGKITQDQVVEIINQRISEFTEKWYPGKGGNKDDDLAFDAHDLWHEAESVGERRELIEKTRHTIDYYQYRLDKICDEIMRLSWSSDAALKRQCSILETTVDMLEQEQWELSVYMLDSPPSESNWNDPGQDATAPSSAWATSRGHINHYNSEREPDSVVPYSPPASSSPSRAPFDHPPPGHDPRHSVEIIDLGSDSESENTMEGDRGNLDVDMQDVPPSTVELDNIAVPSIEANAGVSQRSHLPAHWLPSRRFGSPETSSILTVSKWDWKDLKFKADRKRIVMKVIKEMSSSNRETLRTRLATVRKQHLLAEVPKCVAMWIKGDNKLQGVLPRDLPRIVLFTEVFLCWWLADNYTTKGAHKRELQELQECLQEGNRDPDIFYDWLSHVMANTFSPEALSQPFAPSQAEIIVIDSSDEEQG